jgi:hypothetical protein
MGSPIRQIEHHGHKVQLLGQAFNRCPWVTHYDIEIDGKVHRFAEDDREHYRKSPKTLAEGRKMARALIDRMAQEPGRPATGL